MTHLFKEVELQSKAKGGVVVGETFFSKHEIVVYFFSVNFKVFSWRSVSYTDL